MNGVRDWYDPRYYAVSPQDNPVGPPIGQHRVHRGGCLSLPVRSCRSADRAGVEPEYRSYIVGLRVSLVPPEM